MKQTFSKRTILNDGAYIYILKENTCKSIPNLNHLTNVQMLKKF